MQALFGSDPKCKFNSSREGQDRVLFWQAFQKRVRAEFAGTMITDRRRVQALHETAHMVVKLGVIDQGRVLGALLGAGVVAGAGLRHSTALRQSRHRRRRGFQAGQQAARRARRSACAAGSLRSSTRLPLDRSRLRGRL